MPFYQLLLNLPLFKLRYKFCLSGSEDEISSANRRSHRREDMREDLPLHNAALQELLVEVMRHPDAWAFIRPVQKTEVRFFTSQMFNYNFFFFFIGT